MYLPLPYTYMKFSKPVIFERISEYYTYIQQNRWKKYFQDLFLCLGDFFRRYSHFVYLPTRIGAYYLLVNMADSDWSALYVVLY